MSRKRETSRVATAILLALLTIAIALLWQRVQHQSEEIEVLKTVRSGQPIEYLDAMNLGSFESHKIKLDGSPAELRIYRSVSVRSRDFAVIVDDDGLIRAAFDVSSDDPYQAQYRRLGIYRQ